MKKSSRQGCSCSSEIPPDNCRVEAILAVDERGQVVIPKEVRESLSIHPGERLALVSCFQEGRVCCLVLIPAANLTSMVRSFISPVMSGIIGKNE